MSISVVIPLYNKAAYIGEALKSIQRQTRQPDEVIVVDDGSTDGGPAIAGEFPGVTLIRQANGGVSMARNTGVASATGGLVAFLDADDRWMHDHLSLIEIASEAYDNAGIVCAGYRRINDAGTVSTHLAEPGLLRSFYSQWARGSFTFTSGIAVRRHALQAIGSLFPVGERLGEDQDVWFRLAEVAPVAHTGIISAEYRIDAANNSSGGQAVRDPLPCYRRLGERLASGQVPSHEKAGARRLLASHLINVARARALSGDKAGARALMWTRQATGNPTYWLRSALQIR